MGELTLSELLDVGSKLTAGGVLLFLVIGFQRGWVVPRWVVDGMEKRLDAQDATIDELNRTMRLSSSTTSAAMTTAREAQTRPPLPDGLVSLPPDVVTLIRELARERGRGTS